MGSRVGACVGRNVDSDVVALRLRSTRWLWWSIRWLWFPVDEEDIAIFDGDMEAVQMQFLATVPDGMVELVHRSSWDEGWDDVIDRGITPRGSSSDGCLDIGIDGFVRRMVDACLLRPNLPHIINC